jgi:hypothetical protein
MRYGFLRSQIHSVQSCLPARAVILSVAKDLLARLYAFGWKILRYAQDDDDVG